MSGRRPALMEVLTQERTDDECPLCKQQTVERLECVLILRDSDEWRFQVVMWCNFCRRGLGPDAPKQEQETPG